MNRCQPVHLFLAAAGAILFASLAGGCASDTAEKQNADRHQREAMPPAAIDEEKRDFDAAIVQTHQDDFAAAGIIRQHTIFPYHFVQDSATLNELGQHDVAILAAHYAAVGSDRGLPPSTLSVRRGEASPGLYEARVRAVVAELARGGVANDRVRIADAVPGGDGMASSRIKVILHRDTANKPYYEERTGATDSGVSTEGAQSTSGGAAAQ